MRTPYVVSILDHLHHGEQPSTPAASEADKFDTAVRRLVDIRFIQPPSSTHAQKGQSGRTSYALTEKGAEVAAIVSDVCRK
ncbi:MAG TPA: hypothetical protein VF755_02415 [Catenuloplanes sp.]